MHFKLLIDVGHGNGNRLIHFLDCLLTLLKLTLDAADGQLQQFVLSFRLDDLVLQEVFVLFKGLSTCHPMLDLLIQFLLL